MTRARLRIAGTILLSTIVAGLLGPIASAATSYDPGVDSVYQATNTYRTANGVSALAFDTSVQAVAQAWAEQMAADYANGMALSAAFRHNPNMTSQIPSGWLGAGENIAYNKGYSAPFTKLMDQWKASAPHNANMLNATWNAVGVGVYTDSSGNTWGVQVFAKYPTSWVPTGSIAVAYDASGGVSGSWGSPTSAASTLTSTNGDGKGQNFSKGQALSSAAGTFFVATRVLSAYASNGWIRGSLGWPTANAVCESSGACTQQFQGGKVAVPAGTGAGWVVESGPIADAYAAAGGSSGSWGSQTSSVGTLTSTNGDGKGQNFSKGQALSSAAGTFFVATRVLSAYASNGWIRGSLGWPTANAVCESSGACTQQFQGGVIALPAGTGAGFVVQTGPIADAYAAAGGSSGSWGSQTSSVGTLTSTNGNGKGQNFQQGQALSSAAGTFFVPASILSTYASNGWIRGSLGWPTEGAECDLSGACIQQFQGSAIAVPAGGGAGYVVETGPIADAYEAAGGPSGSWGSQTSSVGTLTSTNGNGKGQNFTQGQALSSVAGTFFVPTRVLSTYAFNGWIRGSLGWPTANAVCESSGACTQQFQGGKVAVPAGTGAGWVVETGPIADAYAAAGGASGSWGARTSSVGTLTSTNGDGKGQNFANGQALSSAAGTFFVPTGILSTYASNGWIRGSLGWPTANAVCESSGACTQQFQGGKVAVPASGGVGTVTLG